VGILDPTNEQVIREGLSRGARTFVGRNCAVGMLSDAHVVARERFFWAAMGNAGRANAQIGQRARVLGAFIVRDELL
jgi:hypothetical protein